MTPDTEGNRNPRTFLRGGDGGHSNTKLIGSRFGLSEREFCAPFEKLPEPSRREKTGSVSTNSPVVWPCCTRTPTGTHIFVKMTYKPDTAPKNCECDTAKTAECESSFPNKALYRCT